MRLQLVCAAVEGTRLGVVQELELSCGQLLVGRAADCGLVLPDASVAPHHLRLAVADNGCTVEDLGGQPGSYLNGRRLTAGHAVPVQIGDRLRLGNFCIQCLQPGARPDPVAPRDDETGDAGPVLQLLDGPRAGEVLPLGPGRRLLLGRGRDCQLQFTDSRVSRRHALIEFCRGRAWISDAGSRNGVLVDGRRLRRRRCLRGGEEITLGRLRLSYRPGAAIGPGHVLGSGRWRALRLSRWWLPAACTAAGLMVMLLVLAT